MKLLGVTSRILRIIFWLVLGILLFAIGIVLMVYSPWGQEHIRQKVVEKLNSIEGLTFQLDHFSLRFPLKLDLQGVMIAQGGDTIVRASDLKADVSLLPLLKGNIDISNAALTDGFYKIGNADSAMYMTIAAEQITLHPASVKISTMDINVENGNIHNGRVDMVLRSDTTSATTDTTSQQTMKVRVNRLEVDNLTYTMRMLPTIDSLGTTIGHGTLNQGLIDLEKQTVTVKSFIGDSINAAYISPDAATIALYPPTPASDSESTSAPWTISLDTISFSNSHALYTTRGVVPQPGMDFAYIEASDMNLTVYGFYNQATTLRMPMILSATERCGVALNATGEFMLNDTEMIFKDFNITTPSTLLNIDGMMGIGDLFTDPSLPLRLKGSGCAGFDDLRKMFPGYAPYLAMFPTTGKADVNIDIDGTAGHINISDFMLALKGCATLNARGAVDYAFVPDRIGGDITLSGHIINVKSIVNAFADPSMGLTVPPMTLKGNVSYHPGITKANLKATTLGGDIALNANYNSRSEGYNLDLTTHQFPVNAFMPDLGVGHATLDIKAKGTGFDIYKHSTNIDATADIASVVYDGYDYRNILMHALINDGHADITGSVENQDLSARIKADGNLRGDTYSWNASLNGERIDLYAMKFMTEPTEVSVEMEAEADITPKANTYGATINLSQLTYETNEKAISINDVKAKIFTNDSLTTLDMHNRDLTASASIPCFVGNIANAFTDARVMGMKQFNDRVINVDTIQHLLPRFDLNLTCGSDNMITNILRAYDMELQHMAISAANDTSISLHSQILGFQNGKTQLDTISVNMQQLKEKMHLIGRIDNRPGTLDNWAHLTLDGMLNSDKVAVRLVQQNINMETGFDFGAIGSLTDSTVTARIFPLNPIIGYKKWTINLDNRIFYNFYTHQIESNLKMKGDKSMIELLSENSTDSIGNPSINDIILKIGDIHLADWISFNPFAPPIDGNLSANMRLKWDGATNINGAGNVSLTDFFYDKRRVASIDLDMNVATNLSGTIRAKADLMIDGEKTMTLAGNLNDSTSNSPFNLDFTLVKFPLATANPFLPVDVAQLAGTLNGSMIVSGDSDRPILTGEIFFTDAAVKVAMTNTSYRFSDVKIPVENNVVTIKDFAIKGENENPLFVNGEVDIASLYSPKWDLDLKANNTMIVNSNRPAKNALIYGKAYIDLDASVKGNMRYMSVDADLTLLSGSNVTYVMTFDDTSLTSSDIQGMVKFVNLNDTAAVAAADTISTQEMLLSIEAQLTVQTATTINVDLPTSSRDKVQIMPQGSLTYSQSPIADPRVTGRINLNSGFVRYTLPVIGSEKTFNVDNGSYIAFNGDMLNPVLNLHATDEMKTNVNIEGQNSRLVNFDIMLGVTGTLEQMDVKFDLSTNDDITIANELQSMSPEQRASQAMNMLLYNMYTGPGTSTNVNLTANPLFSFLESQINNWAAQNIKGVDLSFGIDQYNQTTNGTTSQAMSYSYQVSKTLFNDRFKIVVGGNYTTDNNADENIAENLINDISFEYYLNKQQTMLVKLFRHMGYESILEGEITQTGVGFVYRRKLSRLGQMLPKFMRPRFKNL